jgi:hypothetical protein
VTPPSESDDGTNPVRSRTLRRRAGRWAVRLEGDDDDFVATDLGVGGLFVRGATARGPGSRVRLALDLGARSLDLMATVQWVRGRSITIEMPPGSGLAFDPLSDEDRARVDAAIEEDCQCR